MDHIRCSGEQIPRSASADSEVEYVLGMTVFSNSALTSNPITGVVAYPAGSVLVLLDIPRNKQTPSVHCPGKMITAVNFSPDGKLLLTGECGHPASVKVWQMTDTTYEMIAKFGQFTGVACMSFTPSMRTIVVVGDPHEMTISVWSWPKQVMLSLNKFSDNVYAMAIANDDSFFVTVGHRHMKFYCMDFPNPDWHSSPLPLSTKCIPHTILADSSFCDALCGKKENKYFIFAVSTSGILCRINRKRKLEKWVRVCDSSEDCCYCLAVDDCNVFVGSSDGVIQTFNASSLQLVATLPKPHSLGTELSLPSESPRDCEYDDNIRTTTSKANGIKRSQSCYPAVQAMTCDAVYNNLTVVYDDCSIYIWSRTDQTSFQKIHSSLFHRGCIWDFTLYPIIAKHDNDSNANKTQRGALPPGSLITVSADGTLRSWDVTSDIGEDSSLKRNSVSSTCLKIVYAGGCPEDHPEGRDGARLGKRRSSKGGRDVFSVVTVCPQGRHIATGNRHGEVCVFDAYSMDVLTLMVAHEAEVTVIRYTETHKYKILASGSRDRLIHVMNAFNNYRLMSTIDDHSSTITAIHFTSVGHLLMMVTSSLDMSVLVRTYNDDESMCFRHVRAVVEKKAVVDFALHPWSGQIALVCQGKLVHIHSVLSMHDSYSYRGCPAHGGHLVKISTEPSGLYILTACTNRTVNLIEFESGDLLKTFRSHAETLTRLQFSLNIKHIISSSSDGCIFFWKLPESVTYSVKLVMAEMGILTREMMLSEQWKKSSCKAISLRREKSASCIAISSCSSVVTPGDKGTLRLGDGLGSSSGKDRYGCRDQYPTPRSHSSLDLTDNSDGYQPVFSNVLVSLGCNILTIPSINRSHTFRGEDVKQDVVCDRNDHYPKRRASLAEASFDTWMKACCRRRELFKLEAQSIKRILTMMKLVADAMANDLQNPKREEPMEKCLLAVDHTSYSGETSDDSSSGKKQVSGVDKVPPATIDMVSSSTVIMSGVTDPMIPDSWKGLSDVEEGGEGDRTEASVKED